MRDPYQVLGVPRDADEGEIKRAFRKLAKTLHPDLNPGNAEAERRFKEVNQAYSLLSDAGRRARYDRGEIDEAGEEKSDEIYRSYADRQGGPKYWRGGRSGDAIDLGDVFAEFFDGDSVAGVRARRPRQGQDLSYQLAVDFMDAAHGAKKRVRLAEDRDLDLTIPEGAEDGMVLRLKGAGLPGAYGGPPGDALVTLTIEPHPFFRREGADLHLDVPISLDEAVLGASIKVPTPHGSVAMKVPANSNNGAVLRLKGKGLKRRGAEGRGADARGDLFAHLTLVLPDKEDGELKRFLEGWQRPKGYNPRKKSGWD